MAGGSCAPCQAPPAPPAQQLLVSSIPSMLDIPVGHSSRTCLIPSSLCCCTSKVIPLNANLPHNRPFRGPCEPAGHGTALPDSFLYLGSAGTQELRRSTDPLPATQSAADKGLELLVSDMWLRGHFQECKNQKKRKRKNTGKVSQNYKVLKLELPLSNSRVKLIFQSRNTFSQQCQRIEREESNITFIRILLKYPH